MGIKRAQFSTLAYGRRGHFAEVSILAAMAAVKAVRGKNSTTKKESAPFENFSNLLR